MPWVLKLGKVPRPYKNTKYPTHLQSTRDLQMAWPHEAFYGLYEAFEASYEALRALIKEP